MFVVGLGSFIVRLVAPKSRLLQLRKVQVLDDDQHSTLVLPFPLVTISVLS